MKMEKIKDFENYSITTDGEVFSHKNNVWLKPVYDTDGYRQLSLCKDNKVYTKRMHRLVALTFLPNPNNLPQVNHINGIKKDNRVENLEWCTIQYNNKHSWDMNLRVVSEDKKLFMSEQGKLKRKIVLNLQTGIYYESLKEAAELLGYNYKVLANKIINKRKNNTNLIYV